MFVDSLFLFQVIENLFQGDILFDELLAFFQELLRGLFQFALVPIQVGDVLGDFTLTQFNVYVVWCLFFTVSAAVKTAMCTTQSPYVRQSAMQKELSPALRW